MFLWIHFGQFLILNSKKKKNKIIKIEEKKEVKNRNKKLKKIRKLKKIFLNKKIPKYLRIFFI